MKLALEIFYSEKILYLENSGSHFSTKSWGGRGYFSRLKNFFKPVKTGRSNRSNRSRPIGPDRLQLWLILTRDFFEKLTIYLNFWILSTFEQMLSFLLQANFFSGMLKKFWMFFWPSKEQTYCYLLAVILSFQ
jgi:hypothetical protein